MAATSHSIEVSAPLETVYHKWTQFEEFPQFMHGVEEVRRDGARRLHWKASIAGKEKEWETEIIEEVPNERISWQSIDGTQNSGEITFEETDPTHTRITLAMEYEPEGLFEKAGDALGIPSKRVEENLNRFRDLMEQKVGANGDTGVQESLENFRGTVGTDISTEEISQRAYELYLERGQVPGFDQEDWLAAETELRQKYRDHRPA